MRRVTQLIAFLSFGLLIAIGFQNCAGYSAANNPLFDTEEVVCIGLACGENADYLGLTINSGNLYVQKPTVSTPAGCIGNDSRCVDIAGYCEDGGFPDHQITVGLDGSAQMLTPARCVDGRYRVLVELPSNYNYDVGHTARVVIRGVTSGGVPVENPNNAHVRYVSILTYL